MHSKISKDNRLDKEESEDDLYGKLVAVEMKKFLENMKFNLQFQDSAR